MRDVKDNKKSFYRYISKTKTMKKCGPAAEYAVELATKT